jgi:hypothetical protein
MSIGGISKAIGFAMLFGAAIPEFARAQSVVVRHTVVAEVVPVVGVRDSSWSAPQEIGVGTQTTWSGEIRGNTASELQVLGPSDPNRASYVRAAGGQWVQLTAGAWTTVVVTPVGRSLVKVEVLVETPGAAPPAVRVVRTGTSR